MDLGEMYRITIACVMLFCAGAGGFLRWKLTMKMPASYRRYSHAWVIGMIVIALAVGIGQYRSIHTDIPVNYVTHAFALGAATLAIALYYTVKALPDMPEAGESSDRSERMHP